MLNLIKGSQLENPNALKESYKIIEHGIEAVVDKDHIMKLIRLFIDKYEKETLFLFIDVPCCLKDEEKYHDGKLHKDVYFLKDMSALSMSVLLYMFEEILVNDGISAFGVGCKKGQIGKYQFNVMKAYSADIDTLKNLFETCHISEDNNMITAWDLIDENNQGSSFEYEDSDGMTIYDTVEWLKDIGLYKYKTVDEDNIL